MALSLLVQDYSSHKFPTASTFTETISLGYYQQTTQSPEYPVVLYNVRLCADAVPEQISKSVLTHKDDVTLNAVAAPC